jgi:hypothetical protein
MSTKSPLKLRLQQFVQLVVGLGAAGASHATATVPPTTALDADADLDRYTHAVAERRFPAAGPRAPQPFEPPIAFVPLVALFEQRRLGLRGPAGARVFPATGASHGTRSFAGTDTQCGSRSKVHRVTVRRPVQIHARTAVHDARRRGGAAGRRRDSGHAYARRPAHPRHAGSGRPAAEELRPRRGRWDNEHGDDCCFEEVPGGPGVEGYRDDQRANAGCAGAEGELLNRIKQFRLKFQTRTGVVARKSVQPFN